MAELSRKNTECLFNRGEIDQRVWGKSWAWNAVQIVHPPNLLG